MTDEVTPVELTVDGRHVTAMVDNELLLLHFLREHASATAPKWGCGTGDCGACSISLDGAVVDSCLVYAVECDHAAVHTAVSLSSTPIGALVVEELAAAGAVQCGICTPGFVTTIVAAVHELPPDPSHAQIAELLSGNVCRCTGYAPIVAAVQRVRARLESTGSAS